MQTNKKSTLFLCVVATNCNEISENSQKHTGWGLPPFQPTPPPFPTAALKRNAECTSRKKTGVDTHTNKPKNETKSQKVDRKIGKNGEKEVDVDECVSAALKRAGEGIDVNIEIKQRQLQLSLSLQLEIAKRQRTNENNGDNGSSNGTDNGE